MIPIPTQRIKHDIVIGIDPDIDGSGVAVLHNRVVHSRRMMLPELADFLHSYRRREDVIVVVEAGWLNPSNQHIKGNESARYASKVGERVGRCHEISRQVAEFCKYYKVPYVEKFPLRKTWQSSTGKISHKEMMLLCKGSKVEYLFETKDQEQRDAVLLALDQSNIPLIMAPQKK